MEFIFIFGASVIGFFMVILSVPPILKIARAKKLFEPFEERKVHKQLVPPFGGVAIFIGFILATIITTDGADFDFFKYVIAAIVLMFFVGLKDDLLVISVRKKLIIQIWAGLILTILGNIRITDFHGILGVHELPYILSVVISIFIIVVITNAFNLIDGIDGLASGLAILAASVMGIWFFTNGCNQLAIICMALIGSLAGFFLYNVFGHTNKLFMGDSGSLTIGVILASLIIQFNELHVINNINLHTESAPVLSFAFIIVPMVDTLRVMTIRIAQHKSPFLPDKNHIHHRLHALFQNHLKVTTTLVMANALVIGLALLLQKVSLNINIQFLIILLVSIGMSFVPSIMLRRKQTAEQAMQKQAEQIVQTITKSIALKTYFANDRRQQVIYILKSNNNNKKRHSEKLPALSLNNQKRHQTLIEEAN